MSSFVQSLIAILSAVALVAPLSIFFTLKYINRKTAAETSKVDADKDRSVVDTANELTLLFSGDNQRLRDEVSRLTERLDKQIEDHRALVNHVDSYSRAVVRAASLSVTPIELPTFDEHVQGSTRR